MLVFKSVQHERRQLKRISFPREVEIIGIGIFRCLNLSNGGLYLQNMQPIPVGSVVDLRFKLRDTDEHPLTIQACVIFRHEGEGFGLAFRDLTCEDYENIVRFIKQG
jgi:hypothetical protein